MLLFNKNQYNTQKTHPTSTPLVAATPRLNPAGMVSVTRPTLRVVERYKISPGTTQILYQLNLPFNIAQHHKFCCNNKQYVKPILRENLTSKEVQKCKSVYQEGQADNKRFEGKDEIHQQRTEKDQKETGQHEYDW